MRLDSAVVAISSCPDYAKAELAEQLDRVLGALPDLPELHSCAVLLKPNLISVKYGSLPCTEPAFIVAVARWFLDHGAKVAIGDSPAFGTSSVALARLGIADELLGMGVTLVDFTTVRQVVLPCGETAGMAAQALDCDLLVNLPRVKAHGQTGVTLAVKNCFGCLAGLRKPSWHMVYGGKGGSFCDRIIQLLDVLPDSLTIADGITAMHGTGPLHGEAFLMNVIAASTNPVALDRALLEILGVRPGQSPVMIACRQAGLPGSTLSGLEFPLALPQQVKVADFRIPEQLVPIRFNLFRFLKNSMGRLWLSLFRRA